MSTIRANSVRRSVIHGAIDNMKSIAKMTAYIDETGPTIRSSFGVSSLTNISTGTVGLSLTATMASNILYPHTRSKFTTAYHAFGFLNSVSQFRTTAYDSTRTLSSSCPDGQSALFGDLA